MPVEIGSSWSADSRTMWRDCRSCRASAEHRSHDAENDSPFTHVGRGRPLADRGEPSRGAESRRSSEDRRNRSSYGPAGPVLGRVSIADGTATERHAAGASGTLAAGSRRVGAGQQRGSGGLRRNRSGFAHVRSGSTRGFARQGIVSSKFSATSPKNYVIDPVSDAFEPVLPHSQLLIWASVADAHAGSFVPASTFPLWRQYAISAGTAHRHRPQCAGVPR